MNLVDDDTEHNDSLNRLVNPTLPRHLLKGTFDRVGHIWLLSFIQVFPLRLILWCYWQELTPCFDCTENDLSQIQARCLIFAEMKCNIKLFNP